MAKHPKDSQTECSHIIVPKHLNGGNRLFGGTLIEWIDDVGAITARRHCGGMVTGASMDNVRFLAPAYQNETVVCVGKVTYTGNTSLEVCVKSYAETLDGERRLINVAYQVAVHIDENGKPKPVPALEPETDEEKEEFERAKQRKELRKMYR